MGKKATFYLLHILIGIATIAVAGITIVAMLAARVNPQDAPVTGIFGLLLPGLLFFNFLFFVYWLIRFKWMVLLPLALLCLNYNYYGALYQFGSRHTSPSQKAAASHLKIATFNALKFGGKNLIDNVKEIGAYFREENVDILCLQEYKQAWNFNHDSIKNAFGAYPYSYVYTGPDEMNDLAIFSKYPLENIAYTGYPRSNRGYISADVVTPQKTIRVFNTHLESNGVSGLSGSFRQDLSPEEIAAGVGNSLKASYALRGGQTSLLAHAVQQSPYPVIVCGDFNDTPSSYAYGTLNKLLSDGFRESGKGYAYTYNYYKKLLRIDYIFHSKSLKGVTYYSPRKNWSDHNPVIMELSLK